MSGLAVDNDIVWPQRRLARVRLWVYAVIGGVIGFVLAIRDLPLPFNSTIIAGYFLSVAMHEMGHVGGAWIAGFTPTTFAIWPFQLTRTRDSWKLGWAASNWIGGGFVTVDPNDGSEFRWGMSIVVAGGPAASAVVGVVAAICAANHLGPESLLNSLAIFSLLFAVYGFTPISHRYLVTDGARLQMLRHGGAAVARLRAIMLVSQSSRKGVPPRDWNRELMEQLPGPADGSPDTFTGQVFRFNWLLDSGRIAEAADSLEAILASRNLLDHYRAVWWLEAAWFEARFRGDAVMARRWMDAVPKQYKSGERRCSVYKAEAAIALLEERWADAASSVQHALRECEKMTDLGIANGTRDDLRKLEAEAVAGRM